MDPTWRPKVYRIHFKHISVDLKGTSLSNLSPSLQPLLLLFSVLHHGGFPVLPQHKTSFNNSTPSPYCPSQLECFSPVLHLANSYLTLRTQVKSLTGLIPLDQTSANFSYKRPDRKYFKFCRPYCLHPKYLTLPL